MPPIIDARQVSPTQKLEEALNRLVADQRKEEARVEPPSTA
jgi:hypothetical protein